MNILSFSFRIISLSVFGVHAIGHLCADVQNSVKNSNSAAVLHQAVDQVNKAGQKLEKQDEVVQSGGKISVEDRAVAYEEFMEAKAARRNIIMNHSHSEDTLDPVRADLRQRMLASKTSSERNAIVQRYLAVERALQEVDGRTAVE